GGVGGGGGGGGVGGAVGVVVAGAVVGGAAGGRGVVVVADGSVTSIRPTIFGWRVQWYVYVPAAVKRHSNWPPGPRSPESKETLPGSDVTVCLVWVLFVHRTLSPTLIGLTSGE